MELESIILYLALCLVAGIAGRNRRIGFLGFFFASIVFTPVICLLFLFFATPRQRGPLAGGRPALGPGDEA
jgi:hypothetical protein